MSDHFSPHERALLDALQRADTPEADETLRVKQRLFAELGLGAAGVTAATVASQVSHAAPTAGGALQAVATGGVATGGVPTGGVATGAATLETGSSAALATAKAATTALGTAGTTTKAVASGGFTSVLAKVGTTKLVLGLAGALTTAGGTAAWWASEQESVTLSSTTPQFSTTQFSTTQQPALVPQASTAEPPLAPAVAADDNLAPSTSPVPELDHSSETPTKPRARRTRTTDVTPNGAESTLHDEAALLATAQQRISQGDPRGALTALKEHQERFPGGALSLERQATTALARCLSGQMVAGRKEAERFRRRHPNSPMVKRLETACKLDEQ